MTQKLELLASWQGRKYPIYISPQHTIRHIKEVLAALTGVLPEHQKLLGLVKGRIPDDHTVLESLPALKTGAGFMMMGTPESDFLAEPEDVPEIFDDFDVDYYVDSREMNSLQKENRAQLDKFLARVKPIPVDGILDPRKKLLVVDLDRTLFDHKSETHTGEHLLRPGLHEFLAAVYPKYNLAIWSQSSSQRLWSKLGELGMLNHPEYEIALIMDRTFMMDVQTLRKGNPYKHATKPLQIIWSQFSTTFGPHNTIHMDDLSRNFYFNPQNGIKVRGYHAQHHGEDAELLWLAQYLLSIADCQDVDKVAHEQWKKQAKKELNRNQ